VEESPEDYVNDREIWLSVFPNPFSEQTTINLHGIGHRAEGMELRIYDLSGRLVRSFDLTSSILHPISTLTWDGDSNSGKPLRTGVYFIRLKTRTQSVIKKCLYIK
jgi:flagellar hook assembly protein FlgD